MVDRHDLRGREGMVVKPLDFIAKGRRGFVQPAIKCRGPEYLRIIYGPEYLLPENLTRLRSRAVGAKRSLARREFALGVEALGKVRPQRTAEAHPRVCLRGSGTGKRAGRPEIVGKAPLGGWPIAFDPKTRWGPFRRSLISNFGH